MCPKLQRQRLVFLRIHNSLPRLASGTLRWRLIRRVAPLQLLCFRNRPLMSAESRAKLPGLGGAD